MSKMFAETGELTSDQCITYLDERPALLAAWRALDHDGCGVKMLSAKHAIWTIEIAGTRKRSC